MTAGEESLVETLLLTGAKYILCLQTNQDDQVCLRLLVPDERTGGLDALGDVGGRVAVIVRPNHQYYCLRRETNAQCFHLTWYVRMFLFALHKKELHDRLFLILTVVPDKSARK